MYYYILILSYSMQNCYSGDSTESLICGVTYHAFLSVTQENLGLPFKEKIIINLVRIKFANDTMYIVIIKTY